MQYNALKKRIKETEGGVKKAAKSLGISAKALELKLNGKLFLYAYEADALCTFLDIDNLKDKLYFFYPYRPINGTKLGKGGQTKKFSDKDGEEK